MPRKPRIEITGYYHIINRGVEQRNKLIVETYKDGYSQHMRAKVLGLNQATIKEIVALTSPDTETA